MRATRAMPGYGDNCRPSQQGLRLVLDYEIELTGGMTALSRCPLL